MAHLPGGTVRFVFTDIEGSITGLGLLVTTVVAIAVVVVVLVPLVELVV